ncbi:Cell division ATP-binding protein FtsE [Porphyromonas levii]|nr:Cell division ATP-binding protein FtsE [Porphyromonas levii]MBR8769456.1 Cell division ATP-binding protein FtsE [Porphyromonas levii]MBR8785486.1 Cell division ATP-binding protein FtsE [Porphyromonas levii]MBR8801845.1 Cell division ATP-binding protein FtsE [Porphyromonas levii]MBR8806390.1 Cell division ATP-binding protein FtsE [Porphyromonas levii]
MIEMAEEALLTLKDIIVKRDENIILNGASLDIFPGEFVYLIGRVGAGKSTLIKSVYADLPIAQGEGRFADYDLRKIKRKQIPYLRRHLGIIFQDFQLLTDRSVEKNLEFVLKATGWKDKSLIRNRISEVLEQVGLESKGYKLPHELSGGEQQRVVISRALLNKPKMILADEPTGNLDPLTGEQIVTLLREISNAGTAVLMSTHNYALVKKYPARIVQVIEGKLKEMQLREEI